MHGGIHQPHELIVAILAGTFIFLLFAVFTIVYIIVYLKKRTRHIQEVEKLKSQLKEELLKSSLEIKEQIFNDISQEIHDNVGQLLNLARVQLNMINAKSVFDPELVADLKQVIGQAITDLRDIAKSLSSEKIIALPLEEAIGVEIDRINRSGSLKISVNREGERHRIDEQKKMILFRIIQESLQNILKHARAEEVDISFLYLSGEVHVAIRDNGIGFDPDTLVDGQTGLGLNNMKTRASLMGGSCMIESALDQGTVIRLNIPYA